MNWDTTGWDPTGWDTTGLVAGYTITSHSLDPPASGRAGWLAAARVGHAQRHSDAHKGVEGDGDAIAHRTDDGRLEEALEEAAPAAAPPRGRGRERRVRIFTERLAR